MDLASNSMTRPDILRFLHIRNPSPSPQSSVAKLVVAPIFLLNPLIHYPSASLMTPPQQANPLPPIHRTVCIKLNPTFRQLLPTNTSQHLLHWNSWSWNIMHKLQGLVQNIPIQIRVFPFITKNNIFPTFPNAPHSKGKNNSPRGVSNKQASSFPTIKRQPCL